MTPALALKLLNKMWEELVYYKLKPDSDFKQRWNDLADIAREITIVPKYVTTL